MYKLTRAMKETVSAAGLYVPQCMLSMNADAKTVKGQKKGYLTGIMYLSPSVKRCPSSMAAGCIFPCLDTAGRGAFDNVQRGRANKTAVLEQFHEIAMIAIYVSIQKLVRKAKRESLKPCVRLNGTSDLDWTSMLLDGKTLFEHFPDLQFYDYTKRVDVVRKAAAFDNYHITVSYSSADAYMPVFSKMLETDANIAVVFDGHMPSVYLGLPVIDGDQTDLRFLDREEYKGRAVVGLKAKGKARGSDSPLVVRVDKDIIAIAA